MSGECDKCGEHTLECRCNLTFQYPRGTMNPEDIMNDPNAIFCQGELLDDKGEPVFQTGTCAWAMAESFFRNYKKCIESVELEEKKNAIRLTALSFLLTSLEIVSNELEERSLREIHNNLFKKKLDKFDNDRQLQQTEPQPVC